MEEGCRERTNGLQEARRWMALQESARMGLSPHAQAKCMSYNCWHSGSSSAILLSCNEIVLFYMAFWLVCSPQFQLLCRFASLLYNSR